MDAKALVSIVERSRGIHRSLHGSLSIKHGPVEGVLLTSPAINDNRSDGAPEMPYEQISIDSDGEIIIRFRQSDEHPLFQFLTLLGSGYFIARDAFKHFGIEPIANFNCIMILDARCESHRPTLTNFFSESVTVDLNSTFADAFETLATKLLRASGAGALRELVHEDLSRFDRENLSISLDAEIDL